MQTEDSAGTSLTVITGASPNWLSMRGKLLDSRSPINKTWH
jgi:hypothetical protein